MMLRKNQKNAEKKNQSKKILSNTFYFFDVTVNIINRGHIL